MGVIGTEAWHTAPDETIESVGFLLVETEGADGATASISRWELGIGNLTRLVRVESKTLAEADDEAALLRALLQKQLDPHRRTDPPFLLVTSRRKTVRLLRDRALASGLDATLRGLDHLSLAGLVEEYFDAVEPPILSLDSLTDAAGDDPADVERLRLAMSRVVPLVPRGAAEGEPL